jgi:hypothetical protein
LSDAETNSENGPTHKRQRDAAIFFFEKERAKKFEKFPPNTAKHHLDRRRPGVPFFLKFPFQVHASVVGQFKSLTRATPATMSADAQALFLN